MRLLAKLYPECLREPMDDSLGDLPLHVVSTMPDEDAARDVEFIMDQYPEALRVRNNNGELPIHKACGSFERNCEIIQILLNGFQGSLAERDNLGRVPLLHLASKNLLFLSVDSMILLIQQYPEGVRIADSEGRLPLHLACANTHQLLEAARRFNVAFEEVHERSLQVLRLLLERDPFTILCTALDSGRTALEIAFNAERSLQTLQFLLQRRNEALQQLLDVFQPIADRPALPVDLIVTHIFGFAALSRGLLPTQNEVNE